jgi:hypothetical protein
MLGSLTSIRANVSPLRSRRAMLDTLLRHLDMVRLSIGAVAMVALVGCTGLIQGGNSNEQGLSPEEKVARDKWVNLALPAFQSSTCTTCHGGTMPTVAFLAGTADLDIRTTILGFTPGVVNTDAPQSSRVLTKGAHAGPALDAVAASNILEWIQAEQAAAGASTGGGTTTLTTAPFTPIYCTGGTSGSATCPFNHVSLVDAGMSASPAVDLTGAEISFIVQPLSNDMYITDLTLKGGTNGVYLEHPLVVYVPQTGDVVPDTIDRFFAVKMNLMANATGPIGAGTAAFSGFTPVAAAQLQITFKVLDVYRPMSGGGTTNAGGCKVLTGTNGFYTSVTSVMAATLGGENNRCSNCHMGQNANATSAVDMTGITSTDTSAGGPLNLACNQVLAAMNLLDIPNSGLILAPEAGQDAAHPFKFANQATNFANFKNALSAWAGAEKVAP